MLASRKQLAGTSKEYRDRQDIARGLIERIEAHLKAKKFYLVTANIEGNGLPKLRERLAANLSESELRLLGQEGPTVADVMLLSNANQDNKLYSISIQISSEYLERVLAILREKTGRHILVSPINFVYDSQSDAYSLLEEKLTKGESEG